MGSNAFALGAMGADCVLAPCSAAADGTSVFCVTAADVFGFRDRR